MRLYGTRHALSALPFDVYRAALTSLAGPAQQGRVGGTGQVWLPEFGLGHYKARI